MLVEISLLLVERRDVEHHKRIREDRSWKQTMDEELP